MCTAYDGLTAMDIGGLVTDMPGELDDSAVSGVDAWSVTVAVNEYVHPTYEEEGANAYVFDAENGVENDEGAAHAPETRVPVKEYEYGGVPPDAAAITLTLWPASIESGDNG